MSVASPLDAAARSMRQASATIGGGLGSSMLSGGGGAGSNASSAGGLPSSSSNLQPVPLSLPHALLVCEH